MLDHFVSERARSAGRPGGAGRAAIPAAAVAAIVAVVLALVLPGGGQTAYATPSSGACRQGRAGARDRGQGAQPAPACSCAPDDLPVGGGAVYELWCVRKDGRWVNGGSFQARADGTAAAVLTAAVRPGDYHVVVVTRRSAARARRRGHARQAHLLNLRRAACVHPAMRLLSSQPCSVSSHRGRRMWWRRRQLQQQQQLGGSSGTSTTEQPAVAAAAAARPQTLKITADPSGALKFDKTSLTAKAGKVTIAMDNPSSLPHAVEIEGNGVEEEGDDRRQGRRVEGHRNLKAGKYEFYCPVDGHKEAGMKGTLTVQ